MKSIALLTVLATAVPVVAFAQPPVQTYQRDRDTDRDRYRDQDRDRPDWFRHEHYDRYNNSHWATDVRGRWTRLVRANASSGRREFMIGRQARYHTFRLESTWGQPSIEKIAINFADGTTQVVQFNGAMPAGAGEVIDLQGNERRVGRIVVYADPRSRGGYAIFGT